MKKRVAARQKRMIIIFLILFLILTFFLIKPFLTAVLAAIIITYMFYPLYQFIVKRIKYPSIASFAVIIVLILIISLPLLLLVNASASAIQEISKVESFLNEDFSIKNCIDTQNSFCPVLNKVLTLYHDNTKFKLTIDTALTQLRAYFFTFSTNIFMLLPKFFLLIFTTLFTVYYLLKDSPKMINYFKEVVPIRKDHRENIIAKANEITYAVIYGTFLTALIQGTLAGIGFLIFGFKAWIILGLLSIIASMIPFIGPPVVWVPAVLIKIIEGTTTSNNLLILQAVGMIVYALLIVGTIDNIIKPKIIGQRSNVHPVVILLGIFGGLAVFGIVGIVAGPLILALTETFIQILRKEHEAES